MAEESEERVTKPFKFVTGMYLPRPVSACDDTIYNTKLTTLQLSQLVRPYLQNLQATAPHPTAPPSSQQPKPSLPAAHHKPIPTTTLPPTDPQSQATLPVPKLTTYSQTPHRLRRPLPQHEPNQALLAKLRRLPQMHPRKGRGLPSLPSSKRSLTPLPS